MKKFTIIFSLLIIAEYGNSFERRQTVDKSFFSRNKQNIIYGSFVFSVLSIGYIVGCVITGHENVLTRCIKKMRKISHIEDSSLIEDGAQSYENWKLIANQKSSENPEICREVSVSFEEFLQWPDDDERRELITNVIIPKTAVFIPQKAFYGCSNLKTIQIPSNIKIIKEDAFAGCSALEEVLLSEGLTSIEKQAF